jgi:hypothetical protein
MPPRPGRNAMHLGDGRLRFCLTRASTTRAAWEWNVGEHRRMMQVLSKNTIAISDIPLGH